MDYSYALLALNDGRNDVVDGLMRLLYYSLVELTDGWNIQLYGIVF